MAEAVTTGEVRSSSSCMMCMMAKAVGELETRQSPPSGIQLSYLSTGEGWEFSLLRLRPNALPPYLDNLAPPASAGNAMLTPTFEQTRFRHALPGDDGPRTPPSSLVPHGHRQPLRCPTESDGETTRPRV